MANDVKILLLDSNSLINRAFHALPPLINSDGLYTNAIYGYMTMLNKLITEEKPTHICAVFDCRAKTFRHGMYDGYKATRKPMPEELAMQVPVLQQLLVKLGIKILYKEGYEADDILGTLSKRFDYPTIIVTGDRDCLQLVSDTTTVFNTKKGITEVKKYTPELLAEEGFTPQQIIEYKALAGDSSDNIPGCSGVGDKTAKDLLSEYKCVDGIYEHIDEIKGKLKEKLENNKDMVMLSKRLATIDVFADVECSLDDIVYLNRISDDAIDMMKYLQFKKLIEKFAPDYKETDVKSTESKKNETKEKIYDVSYGENKEYENKIKNSTAEVIEISDENTLTDEIKNISENDKIFFDFTESNAIIGIENKIYSIKTTENLIDTGISYETVIDVVKPLVAGKNQKFFFDAKKNMRFLSAYGVKIEKPYDDLLLMAYLINNTKVIKNAEMLAEEYCYSTENVYGALCDIYPILKEKITEKNLTKLYYEIELPLIEVLFDMEQTGFSVNGTMLEELNVKYAKEINELLQEIYSLAGQTFNVNSNKQLGFVLFDTLGLPHSKKTKTGYSVDADTLEELDHPIVTAILRYRELAKLKSTYVEGMKQVMNPLTGKVHTCFNQCITATGRLSSTEPNLQNIPVRKSEGREIRKMFIPSEGNVLVTADYSQIELRLLAHFSEEPKLIESYQNGCDIHALTASKIFNVPLEDVTPEMRTSAKAVNFGIIYGISGFGLSKNAGVTRYQAKNFIEQYFITYPKVKEYMDSNVSLAKKQGYLTTLFGRIRYFPELTSPKFSIRAFGERAAMNMPLQGTASDIIKISMLKVHDALKNQGLKAKLILQVHDELIVDAPKEEEDAVKEILKNNMESAANLRVPLTVNVSCGSNWYASK